MSVAPTGAKRRLYPTLRRQTAYRYDAKKMGQGRTFVWADTGSIRIMVHGRKAPSDEEWEQFLSRTVREVDGRFVAQHRRGAVIYSQGGMATPRQRSALRKIDIAAEDVPSLVLMSNSRLVRGVATAIGWIVPSVKNFHALSLEQVDEAARLLSPMAKEQAEFKEVLASLLTQLED